MRPLFHLYNLYYQLCPEAWGIVFSQLKAENLFPLKDREKNNVTVSGNMGVPTSDVQRGPHRPLKMKKPEDHEKGE